MEKYMYSTKLLIEKNNLKGIVFGINKDLPEDINSSLGKLRQAPMLDILRHIDNFYKERSTHMKENYGYEQLIIFMTLQKLGYVDAKWDLNKKILELPAVKFVREGEE